MKKWSRIFLLVFIQSCFAMAKEPPIYSCRIKSDFLTQQKSSADFVLKNLDAAEFKFKTPDEEFRCPVEVETIQDGTRFAIAQITIKMSSAKCNSSSMDINKFFRKRINLKISSQPGLENDGKMTWKIGEANDDCLVLENNLRSHGLGILRNSKGLNHRQTGNQ